MRRVDHEFAREIYLKMRRIVQGVQQIEIVKGQEIDLSEGYSQDLRDDLLSYNPDSGSTVEVLQRITELAAFFGTTMVIVGMEVNNCLRVEVAGESALGKTLQL